MDLTAVLPADCPEDLLARVLQGVSDKGWSVEQSRGGEPTFSGHGVYTWDAQAGEVVLHWFDCMGQGSEEFRGKWDGDRLVLGSRNPMGFARMTHDYSQAGTLTSRMEMSPDGEAWTPLFDGTYQRKD